MNKIVAICGPTATGKTELGIKMAKKLGGEIVSADSRQVYRGMDVGTGKDLPKSAKRKAQSAKLKLKTKNLQTGYYLMNGVKIWLYDVADPDGKFSVAQYYDLAWKVIEDIRERGKLPILVGGTGFYIKAVIDGIESLGVEPDWGLRKILGDKDIKILGEELKKVDPKRWGGMNESDRINPRRLIRAIEIGLRRKRRKNKSYSNTALYHSEKRGHQVLFIGLTAPYKILYQRIDKRVEERIKMGAVEEVENLLKKGYGWNLPSMSAMGYREFKPFFDKKTTLKEVVQRWKFDEHGYARRQMTWFRKDPRIRWFDITEPGWKNRVEELVERWYTNRNYAAKN